MQSGLFFDCIVNLRSDWGRLHLVHGLVNNDLPRGRTLERLSALSLLNFLSITLTLPPPLHTLLLLGKALPYFLGLLFLPLFVSSLLFLQIEDGQVDDLLPQMSFLDRIGGCGVVSLPLEPEKVLVIIVSIGWPIIAQIFEPRQVKLAAEV